MMKNITYNKILIIAAIAVVLLGVFFSYKYLFLVKKDKEDINNEEKAQTIEGQPFGNTQGKEKGIQQDNQVKIEAIGVEGENNQEANGLTICSDKCGDGICQNEDLSCEGGNLNCVCAETPADCPQDCK